MLEPDTAYSFFTYNGYMTYASRYQHSNPETSLLSAEEGGYSLALLSNRYIISSPC